MLVADHADVATQRNGLDAILRLAAATGPDRWAEADHELRDPHAEALGRQEMAEFVPTDGEGHPQHHEQHRTNDGENGHAFPP